MKFHIFVEQGHIEEELQIKPYWSINTEVHHNKFPLLSVDDEKVAYVICDYLKKSFGLSYDMCDDWQEFDCVNEKELKLADVALIEYYKENSIPPQVQTIIKEATTKLPIIKKYFSSSSPTHYMSIKELTRHYDITDKKQMDAFKKRIERTRTGKKGDDETFYKEVERTGRCTCQYIYDVEAVRPIAEKLKDKYVLPKRPLKKT